MTRLVERGSETSSKSEHEIRLYRIATKMQDEGLNVDFVARAVRAALKYEGMADMLVLWDEAQSNDEKADIIASIDEEIDDVDIKDDPPIRKPKINYKELDLVAEKIVEFKRDLRKRVDEWGGITELARATGIPQPSLSRFFSGASMPRRTTLYKIANAMDLSETEISTPWTR
jgi:DNA-binding phage protein